MCAVFIDGIKTYLGGRLWPIAETDVMDNVVLCDDVWRTPAWKKRTCLYTVDGILSSLLMAVSAAAGCS